MITLRRALQSRRASLVGVLGIVGAGLGLISANATVRIDLNPLVDSHVLPASILVTLAVAACAAAVTRPRFYSWERLGQRGRSAAVAGVAAVIGILASLAPVVGPLVRWPEELALAWVVADSLLLASAVYLLAALVSPFLAGGIVAVGFVAHGITYNLQAVPEWLTALSGMRDVVSWLPTLTVLTLTVVVHAVTRGATSFTHRMASNEE